MSEHFQIGDKIQGRWQVLRVLEGPTCIVFIVFDHKLNRSLAAKVLQEKVLSSTASQKFSEAAQAWIALSPHANVVKAHFIETIGERHFLFTDYVAGGSLVQGISHNLPLTMRLAIHLCDGMTHAAENGLAIHGGLKPRNCLITRDGTLKLTDFGMAGVLDAPMETGVAPALLATRMFKRIATGVFRARSQSSSTSSTPTPNDRCYLAPELLDAPHRRNVKSDLYSFGVILFEMITGRLPFGGDSANAEKNHAPSLADRSEPLNEIVQACLAKSPSARPASFDVVRTQLATVYQQLTGHAVPPTENGLELETIEASRESLSLRELGLSDRATEYFDTALGRNPQQVPFWLSLGSRLRSMSSWADAVRCYERALEIEPNNPEALAGKGTALLRGGRTDEASACADHVMGVAPENDAALVLMGTIWTTIGRPQVAGEYFEKALKANPKSADAWFQKGMLLKAEQPGESIACFERAIELNPRDDEAWIMKGEVMGHIDRHHDEVSCYDRALEINLQNAEAWYRKGMAFCSGMHRYQDAMTCLEEARKLGHPRAADGIATCKPLLEFTEKTNTYARIKRPAQ